MGVYKVVRYIRKKSFIRCVGAHLYAKIIYDRQNDANFYNSTLVNGFLS